MREIEIDVSKPAPASASVAAALPRRNSAVTEETQREPARDPQDLERLLIDRQWAGDVDGMLALFEPEAIIDTGEAELTRGHAAIRALFETFVASGRKFQRGEQRPAAINGDLALTSTRLADGSITSEVARRQADGTWLWVIDRYSVSW
jgi:ketosteroid isomerase-like protein